MGRDVTCTCFASTSTISARVEQATGERRDIPGGTTKVDKFKDKISEKMMKSHIVSADGIEP